MGWKRVTAVSQRKEFIKLALQEGTNISELCRRFGVSRKTGYKFLKRYHREGLRGLFDYSRRPLNSPNATDPKIEKMILDLREEHECWGGRKLKRWLEKQGHRNIPSPSTITAILQRNGYIDPGESEKHKAWQYFEAERPNDLWQMDFKGHFPVAEGPCHPLTILDDHARYSVCLSACADETRQTVKERLTHVFRRYGLPLAMLMDNGPPWGHGRKTRYTTLSVWLLHLGINVIYSRPFHPQTLGKEERFHRTLNAEVIGSCMNTTLEITQQRFDAWRVMYNTERPHQALDQDVPASRYRLSPRPFPETLPSIEYGPDDIVRKVQDGGIVHFKNEEYRVSNSFKGYPVAIRPTSCDGVFDICFLKHVIGHIDIT
jgi:transposase InsO family protein